MRFPVVIGLGMPPVGPPASLVDRRVIDMLGAPLTIVEHRNFLDRYLDGLFAGGVLVAVNTDTGQAVRIVNVEP